MANKTNVERVTEYMEFGSPLNQAFAILAITKEAENIVKNEAKVLKELENSMLHGPVWVKCAKDWLATQELQQETIKTDFYDENNSR